MSTTTLTQITVTSSGDGIGSSNEYKPTKMTNAAGVAGGPVHTTLAAADNTIAVPTGAKGMVIAPPAASLAVLKLKGGAGETGFALRTGEASSIPLPTGTANVLLNSSIVEVVYIHWT